MKSDKTLAHFEAFYPDTTREAEMNTLFTHLKKGDSSQVVGLPGAGRSTILSLLAYNKMLREKYLESKTQWFHFVYMDLSEVKGRGLFDVIKFILISLSYSLLERKMTEEQDVVNKLLKEGLEFKDELILFQSLKKSIDYLAIEKEYSIIFLFDRFDQYLSDITEEFFSNLKVLRNRAKYRFSAIFSLNRPLQDILEPTLYGEYYEFLIENIVYVSLYDPVGSEFRFSYIEKVSEKKLSDSIKKNIIQLTGGHGKLLRVSHEALLAEDTLPENVSDFLLKKTTIQGALYEIWSSLLPEEQELIKTGSIKNVDRENKTFEYLLHTGLIEKNGSFAIPLFKEFVQHLPTRVENEEITYDSETNDVYKGKQMLSELLSPSEFRLLRFLIQHKDRVCEKDEIINAIWKEQATQVGVTDQALDQVVYRLRKKIETDPNNPTHIHTVKGRGYKFSV